MRVNINKTEYTFLVLQDEDQRLKESFNKLAMETFGIRFEHVGNQYLPYVLVHEGEVVANVSVNHMHIRYEEESRFYIQLGTVMTKVCYRNRGLSGWLMEQVLRQWSEQCDGLYLFANDSVLEYYPKFGFVKGREYHQEMVLRCPEQNRMGSYRRLDVDHPEDRRILLECYAQYNPYARLSAGGNEGVLLFYCESFMKHHIYYLEEQKVVVIAKWQNDNLECMDIYGDSKAPLSEILGIMLKGEEKKVILGFTTDDTGGWETVPHQEKDTTLFIRKSKENLFADQQLMFPVLSHT